MSRIGIGHPTDAHPSAILEFGSACIDITDLTANMRMDFNSGTCEEDGCDCEVQIFSFSAATPYGVVTVQLDAHAAAHLAVGMSQMLVKAIPEAMAHAADAAARQDFEGQLESNAVGEFTIPEGFGWPDAFEADGDDGSGDGS